MGQLLHEQGRALHPAQTLPLKWLFSLLSLKNRKGSACLTQAPPERVPAKHKTHAAFSGVKCLSQCNIIVTVLLDATLINKVRYNTACRAVLPLPGFLCIFTLELNQEMSARGPGNL